MEDLRKDYNVSNPNKKSIWKGLSNVGSSNTNILKLLVSMIVISFIIFKPHVIGKYIGRWFNDLTQSFNTNVVLGTDQWYVVLITISVLTICYSLIKWVNKN